MQAFHNVEKSAFRRGEYVGWDASGRIWLIKRSSSSFGNWCARCRDREDIPMLYTFRLRDMADKLYGTITPPRQ